ncbi:CLUMA_CG011743, isoform A [Clunio marinus]|uniref:CLUMA_CG011743, isoform A n=1 Tax=Clunio marinus TaxID=568069 RepID=A0A1J1IDU0_9DIPT|nr:CLUMA_CG011743, isoform A [Clunio marinus]
MSQASFNIFRISGNLSRLTHQLTLAYKDILPFLPPTQTKSIKNFRNIHYKTLVLKSLNYENNERLAASCILQRRQTYKLNDDEIEQFLLAINSI